jgi:hypothetical protein
MPEGAMKFSPRKLGPPKEGRIGDDDALLSIEPHVAFFHSA